MSARQYDPGPPAAFEALFGHARRRRPSATISGSTGAPSSTVAGSTARLASSPSRRTRAPRSGSSGAPWSATPGSGSRGSSPRSGSIARTSWPTPSRTASSRATGRWPRRSCATRTSWPGATSCTTRSPARTSRRSSRSGSMRRTPSTSGRRIPALPVHRIPHPSSHSEPVLLDAWRAAVTALRGQVTPDPGAPTNLPNYGADLHGIRLRADPPPRPPVRRAGLRR